MKLSDIYSSATTSQEEVSQPVSANRDTAPKPVGSAGNATVVSWLGLLIALVLLRLVYEVSE